MILETDRLRLRRVDERDLEPIVELASDARVMAPLGGTTTREQTAVWLSRVLAHWRDHDYGRYIVTTKDDAFAGIVGLSRTDFDAGIVPGIEIAWRLAYVQWGHGYATEAARAALADADQRLGIRDVIAVTTIGNARSRAVMQRLGMALSPTEAFDHPKLPEGSPLRAHVVYRRIPSSARKMDA